jgi:hypothetical protein
MDTPDIQTNMSRQCFMPDLKPGYNLNRGRAAWVRTAAWRGKAAFEHGG